MVAEVKPGHGGGVVWLNQIVREWKREVVNAWSGDEGSLFCLKRRQMLLMIASA